MGFSNKNGREVVVIFWMSILSVDGGWAILKVVCYWIAFCIRAMSPESSTWKFWIFFLSTAILNRLALVGEDSSSSSLCIAVLASSFSF